MEFMHVLQSLLEQKGISQADLCRETDIPSSLMSNYLKGKKSPGMDNSIKIADYFGISLDELAGRSGGSAEIRAKEKPANIDDDGLSEPQKAVLLILSNLDADGQRAVLDFAEYRKEKKEK